MNGSRRCNRRDKPAAVVSRISVDTGRVCHHGEALGSHNHSFAGLDVLPRDASCVTAGRNLHHDSRCMPAFITGNDVGDVLDCDAEPGVADWTKLPWIASILTVIVCDGRRCRQ